MAGYKYILLYKGQLGTTEDRVMHMKVDFGSNWSAGVTISSLQTFKRLTELTWHMSTINDAEGMVPYNMFDIGWYNNNNNGCDVGDICS